jgi:hypothetical protein
MKLAKEEAVGKFPEKTMLAECCPGVATSPSSAIVIVCDWPEATEPLVMLLSKSSLNMIQLGRLTDQCAVEDPVFVSVIPVLAHVPAGVVIEMVPGEAMKED